MRARAVTQPCIAGIANVMTRRLAVTRKISDDASRKTTMDVLYTAMQAGAFQTAAFIDPVTPEAFKTI